MILDNATINLYSNFLCFPQKYGCEYKLLGMCFAITDVVTPQHILYEKYIEYIKKPLPKVGFYIIMKMRFGHYRKVDKRSGNVGYRILFTQSEETK